jgi:hypothetical protein
MYVRVSVAPEAKISRHRKQSNESKIAPVFKFRWNELFQVPTNKTINIVTSLRLIGIKQQHTLVPSTWKPKNISRNHHI